MRFLNNLNDRLTAMERDMQTLSAELDSIVARLNSGTLQGILIHLEKDCDELYEKQSASQRAGVITLPFIIELSYPNFIREITNEDLLRWRAAYKSEVRVVIGEGRVEVFAVSDVAGNRETTVSQITIASQQKGSIVLKWDQYQKLLDEIGKLISDEEG